MLLVPRLRPAFLLPDGLAIALTRHDTRLVLRCAILLCLCIFPACAQFREPIKLHPENPHYLLWNGKPAILITSTEQYGAVLNLDFDWIPYLDELKVRGFNLTRVFSGAYREIQGSFNIKENTLAPANGRFICPWARSSTDYDI